LETVLPLGELAIFSAAELQLLLNGVTVLDVEEWKAHTAYSGDFSPEHPVRQKGRWRLCNRRCVRARSVMVEHR
jgi:hypothetical protein